MVVLLSKCDITKLYFSLLPYHRYESILYNQCNLKDAKGTFVTLTLPRYYYYFFFFCVNTFLQSEKG